MLARLLLAAVGTLLSLAVAEAYLRWTTAPGAYIVRTKGDEGWVEHPFLPFIGKPSDDRTRSIAGLDWQIRVRNNRHGFRAHELPAEKGPNDFVVVCLGGSTTWGEGAERNDTTWPELLEAMLAARYPQRNVRVFNLGVPNADSAYSVLVLALFGVHLQPDLVIDYDGWNDIKFTSTWSFRTDHAHILRKFDPDAIGVVQRFLPAWLLDFRLVALTTAAIENWTGLTDLRSYVVKPFVVGWPASRLGMQRMLDNLKTIHAIARGAGAQVVFATFQFFHGGEYATSPLLEGRWSRTEMARDFFASNDFLYVDLDRLFPDMDPSLQYDEGHFTPAGEQLVAQKFFDFIVDRGLLPGSPQ